MDWVKLGVRYYLDPAIRGMDGDLGDAAEVMFTRGLARAGEVGGDGFIPERDVPLLARRRRYEAVVSLLLRSGLWTDAPGGYRIVRWSDWQDHLDALTRKRAVDRERQRARRAAARNGRASTREDRPPPHASRDPSRDVAAGEGEGEGLKGGDPSYGPQSPDTPPPRTCPKHTNDPDPPNCGGCKDARLAWEQHRADRARQRALDTANAPRCPRHRGQPASNCAPCRAEQLAADREDRP